MIQRLFSGARSIGVDNIERAWVGHYGLSKYLGAGPEALDKFEKSAIANPVNHTIVQAAVN